MKKETKLQQKLFDKRTLTWKNENHAKNEQNRIKAILRIFDFVNNPIQFDFIFFVILCYTGPGPNFLTLKVAA